jgi:hypothetical protein
MAIALWKQVRIWGIQKVGFDLEMARLNSPSNLPAARAAMVFKTGRQLEPSCGPRRSGLRTTANC